MTKLVILRLGDGNFDTGLSATLRIEEYSTLLVDVSGKLPRFPELSELFECWQLAYSSLEFSWRSLRKKPQINTSIIGIDRIKQLSYNLKETLNDWLNDQEFRSIKEALLMHLSRSEEVRVLIQTADIQLRRLPWHLWDIFEYYPKAEIAFSESIYTRIHRSSSSLLKDKVRILAVLGNSHGINLQKDQELLANLPNVDIRFLVEPSRRELDRELWEDKGWDILFFAGHSYSKNDGKTGYLCINSTQDLPISQLRNALKASIERGLQIAIFNSCDGLGIAQSLSDLHIPQVICMREPVPDIVAHEFLLHFLKSFSSGKSLYISVREAREKLEGLENDFPCATWLPVILQNIGESLATWQELCPMSLVTQQQTQNEDGNLYTKRVEAWNKCRKKNLDLVPDLKGINLSGVNLAGANLSRVNLSGANLTGANLSSANLSEANLTGANLTAAQVLNTNFENALLTGACIQDWNINKETKLDGIICSYVYLQGSQQERRPSSGNFALGDFAHLVQKVVEAIELIFRNGIDFKAFAYSIKKLQAENEDTQLDVQSLENKGDGIVIVRLSVSPEADKAKIHSKFIQNYELAKEALEAQYQARLEDKEKYINQLVSLLNESQNRLAEMSNLKSETFTYNMRNVKISNFVSGSMQGSHIGDNQYNYAPEHKQTLAEAAAEIQQLLEQLDKSYPTNTTAGKMAVASEAIQYIESNPTLKERILSALKASGINALETLLLHPAASFVISALEDWQKDKKFY